MATVKAIDSRSVHQIQSGQVIIDLVSVVKELAENSLDAGATSIDVRFKNHGLESIEVQDNGKGIAPDDFETIALKHYTSKLSTYEDLTSLDTFGFRGEALSSLCALSNFHIVTARTEDGAVGKKLEFETSGKLTGSAVVAAQRGSTVTVENLFSNLPVRRKELEKNIKREYGKALSHLYAYACISVGVRFAVSNQMPKAKKVPVFSTKVNTTTKENVANVFGAKTLVSLVKLDLHLEMEPRNGPSTQSARNWSTQATDRSMEVKVQGHISKPIFGEGRQAPDRQMFFVNSRPCALPQVSKAFNEVYKAFNVSQTPFIFANLIMDTHAYDVNVSPDKRSIMLHDQTALLENLKSSLTELFEQSDYTVPQSQLPNRKLPSYKLLTVPQQPVGQKPSQADEQSSATESASEDETEAESHFPLQKPKVGNRIDGTPPSLVHDWVGRDSEPRNAKPVSYGHQNGLSKDKKKLVDTMHMKNESQAQPRDVDETHNDRTKSLSNAMTEPSPEPSETEDTALVETCGADEILIPADQSQARDQDPMGSPFGDLFSQRPIHLQKRVEDFKALMDRRHTPPHAVVPGQPSQEALALEDEDENESKEIEEPSIPAIAPSSQKATPGPVQNAFDRMRPKRTPLQTAEITIGDQTTTAVIGSDPPYKKRRMHQPHDSQSIAQFGASPLLARGLRTFAAPGSQLEIDSSNVLAAREASPVASEDESEDEAAEDLSKGQLADTTAMQRKSSKSRAHLAISSDIPASEPLDALVPAQADDDEYDEDYVDEEEKKMLEDEKVARLIQQAELAAAQPTEENLRRASQVLKNTGNRKDSTLRLAQYLDVSEDMIRRQLSKAESVRQNELKGHHSDVRGENAIVKDEIDDSNAESRLSLTVSKADFEHMTIIGQFNLGFILAVRPTKTESDEDELFIIDQHAADEKYNYERLQRTVTLQNQRLVRPKPLDLTAVEEEIILNNADALKANGFEIEVSSDADDECVGRSCCLLTLPMSREKTFELSDLEELLHLLSEAPAGSSEIPRPKKVQSMLAMRACRSSIMVGKTLTLKQMQKVIRHMGEMEKPWNCPHGRPTMRHLAGLGACQAWQEGDAIDQDEDFADIERDDRSTDWQAFLRQKQP